MKKQHTTNAINRDNLHRSCMLNYTLSLIEGRWKGALMMKIQEGVDRFGRLKESLPGISEKMLAQQLKELEQDGLISRTVFAEVPPRTAYALTTKGEELHNLLQQLCDWGMQYAPLTADYAV